MATRIVNFLLHENSGVNPRFSKGYSAEKESDVNLRTNYFT